MSTSFFHFGIALAIIAEHAFYLWDRAPSDDAGFFMDAIDAYESSAKHTAVTQAIDEAFAEDRGACSRMPKTVTTRENPPLRSDLYKLRLDNRLCT